MNLPHRHRLPLDPSGRTDRENPQGLSRYPTLVMLHGWLGNENVMWAFESALPPRAVIVSPRAPLVAGEEGYGWFYKQADNGSESISQGLEALHTFLTQLPAAYPVDPTRIYLMGFSQGAAMCYLYALAHPQRVAGLVSLMGFLPESLYNTLTPNSLSQRPLLMLTGTEDDQVPLAQARATHQALLKTGATIAYKEYATGHKLNVQGMRDLKHWLSEQIR